MPKWIRKDYNYEDIKNAVLEYSQPHSRSAPVIAADHNITPSVLKYHYSLFKNNNNIFSTDSTFSETRPKPKRRKKTPTLPKIKRDPIVSDFPLSTTSATNQINEQGARIIKFSGEKTIEAMKAATRDKTREKTREATKEKSIKRYRLNENDILPLLRNKNVG